MHLRFILRQGIIMRILLINPKIPQTFWSFKNALKFIAKKSSEPPLGLLTVAAMLPAEWQLRLIDLNVTVLKDKHCCHQLPNENH